MQIQAFPVQVVLESERYLSSLDAAHHDIALAAEVPSTFQYNLHSKCANLHIDLAASK